MPYCIKSQSRTQNASKESETVLILCLKRNVYPKSAPPSRNPTQSCRGSISAQAGPWEGGCWRWEVSPVCDQVYSHPSLAELWQWLQHPTRSCFSVEKLISGATVNSSVFHIFLKANSMLVVFVQAWGLHANRAVRDKSIIMEGGRKAKWSRKANAVLDTSCSITGEFSCLAPHVCLLLNHTLNFLYRFMMTNWQILTCGAMRNHSKYGDRIKEPDAFFN